MLFESDTPLRMYRTDIGSAPFPLRSSTNPTDVSETDSRLMPPFSTLKAVKASPMRVFQSGVRASQPPKRIEMPRLEDVPRINRSLNDDEERRPLQQFNSKENVDSIGVHIFQSDQ